MLLKISSGSTSFKHNFPDKCTWTELKMYIEEKTGQGAYEMDILADFPPVLVRNACPDTKLSDLGIESGTLITVRTNADRKTIYKNLIEAGYSASIVRKAMDMIDMNDLETCIEICEQLSEMANSNDSPSNNPPHSGKMTRKVIPADNSCLFNSIGELVEGDGYDHHPSKYRRIVAEYIKVNRDFYTADMLEGKEVDVYIQWIMDKDKWGGEIEISILASQLKIEIAVVDIRTGTTLVYGSDGQSAKRIYLLYDGVHYDALLKTDGKHEVTLFDPTDGAVLAEVEDMARELQRQRKYVNLATGQLMCGVCNKVLAGQKEAVEHAKLSGHQNFTQA